MADKKNILLLTSIYPMNDPLYDGTMICHFFAREWVKQGHNVRVVHFMSLFPRPYYWVGHLLGGYIASKTGCITYSRPSRHCLRYKVEDVPVLYVPVKKYIPHRNFSKSSVQESFSWVCRELEAENFVPDVVTGHFPLPQLEMLYLFKHRYQSVKTCMVLHDEGSQILTAYPGQFKKYMDAIDVWGFRSRVFKSQFEETFFAPTKSFICYSGIPGSYLSQSDKNLTRGIHKFVFVGDLIQRKNVDVIMKALHNAFPSHDFEFHVVGSGAEESRLRNMAIQMQMSSQIVFHGKKKRNEVQQIVEQSDCFVMVSYREAFGLVYLEAMAKGCITVGLKGQGIDGVIIDGVNGFLCATDQVEDLADVLKKIRSLHTDQLQSISQKARETVMNLTDENAAEHYLNSIL